MAATQIGRSESSGLSLSNWFLLLPIITFAAIGFVQTLPSFLNSGLTLRSAKYPFNLIQRSNSVRSLFSSEVPMSDNRGTSFLDAVMGRRTWYALNDKLPISQEEITSIVNESMQAVPSSFNSQSNRAVVLFGDEHQQAWNIVTGVLKARVSAEQWVTTEEKTKGFKAAAGTVLFFVDEAIVQEYVTNIPSYASQFPVWATQSDAMLQHTIWTALSAEGIGANLQHYNPIIDDKIRAAWDLPSTWRLTAQLCFGGRAVPDVKLMEKKPVEGKVKVFGND